MTQDEIIEMARHAGIDHHKLWNDDGTNNLEAFAKLVAAKEREACAKVCDKKDEIWAKAGLWNPTGEYKECAAAIRARGEA